MPVHVERRAGRYRIIEPTGGVAQTPKGISRDGGGHETRSRAEAQARAINEGIRKSMLRTLYISRRLLNAADLIRWATAQGFTSIIPPEHMHVTIAFSRAKVSWDAMGAAAERLTALDIHNRRVTPLGDKGVVVLMFQSASLQVRHAQLHRKGCEWEWDSYVPHVTLTYDGAGVDLSLVDPFTRPLQFGPEDFREVEEEWEKTLKEIKVSA